MESNPSVSSDRGIGPEKLSVRIFREVAVPAMKQTGQLKPVLDEYLRRVLIDPNSKKSDKTYARKIYTDLIRQTGAPEGLPEWARRQTVAEEALTDADINEMLTGLAPEPPRVEMDTYIDPSEIQIDPNEISIEDDPALVFLGQPQRKEPNPFESTLNGIMDEYRARLTHPFMRSFEIAGQRYVAIGTFVGKVMKGEDAGKSLNVNFTVNHYRTRRDIPDDILMQHGGRTVSLRHEDERECRRFLFVLRHQEGRKVRFWTRVGEKDAPGSGKYVIMTNDAVGWRQVTRSEF